MPKHRLDGHLRLEPGFLSRAGARALRQRIEDRFADPRAPRADRFVWDYWHIPEQYTLLRTPARAFFSPAAFGALEKRLLDYARTTLGCSGLSEPWLSVYVEGCYQNLHADSPHGPWAYVYSLTDWDRRAFSGGETLVLRPEVLEFWRRFESDAGLERDDLLAEIPARYNQLLVFDPRLPHGVKEVRGVREPPRARIAIHGWFTEPRPFLDGALSRGAALARKAGAVLDSALERAYGNLGEIGALHGTCTVRLEIGASGRLAARAGGAPRVRILANTVLDRSGYLAPTAIARRISAILADAFRGAEFPRAAGKTALTVPLLFR